MSKANRRRFWTTGGIVLLGAAALAVGCWAAVAAWMAWPGRTLEELCRSVAQGDFDRANGLLVSARWAIQPDGGARFAIDEPTRHFASVREWRATFREAIEDFKLEPRSISELLGARARLTVKGRFEVGIHHPAGAPSRATPVYEFTAERGRISVTRTLVVRDR